MGIGFPIDYGDIDMGNWKKGDKFISLITLSENTRIKGKVYTIAEDTGINVIKYRGESGTKWTSSTQTVYKLDVLNNPLNKKLYPKRVEWQGYLIAAEIRDKLNEDDK